MSSVTDARPSLAVEETLELLRTTSDVEPDAGKGYVDLLGEREAIGPTFAEQTMRNKKVSRIYERVWRPMMSRAFLGFRGPRMAEERRILLGMLAPSEGDRVLDVGCGPGTYTRHLAEVVGNSLVIGFDASEAMLEATGRYPGRANIAYVRGDACSLPFDDATFDAVCCAGAFHVFSDPMGALGEMARVVAPGGRVGLLTTCKLDTGRRRPPRGIQEFGHDEVTDAMAGRGLVGIEQRVFRRAQFVAGRKVEG